MEIRIPNDVDNDTIPFKIDLIVWKWFRTTSCKEWQPQFKIDLIVWKLSNTVQYILTSFIV